MSLLDSVIGALGSQGGGGGRGDPLQAIIGMLGQGGGLSGVLGQLSKAGLGDAVNSWVGTGANQPVSPDALGNALGSDAVAGFARQLGIEPGEALGHLSQMLPQVVDKLTPNGQVPQGDLGSLLGSLTGGGGSSGGLGDLAGMLGGMLGKR